MILVDTSVWIDHLRSGEPDLAAALGDGLVMMHPFVLGELACGNLQNPQRGAPAFRGSSLGAGRYGHRGPGSL